MAALLGDNYTTILALRQSSAHVSVDFPVTNLSPGPAAFFGMLRLFFCYAHRIISHSQDILFIHFLLALAFILTHSFSDPGKASDAKRN